MSFRFRNLHFGQIDWGLKMTWSNDGPVILTELRRWALSTYRQKRERINGSDTAVFATKAVDWNPIGENDLSVQKINGVDLF